MGCLTISAYSLCRSNALLSAVTDDFWSIDLCEGDVLGAESFAGGTASTSRRLTTAVAVAGVDSNEPVKLAYLLLDEYLAVSSPWEWFTRENSQNLCAMGNSQYKR